MEIAICALIKDEHRYLKEWIEYYLKMGVTQFYLYEDYGSKPHGEITKDYPEVCLSPLSNLGIPENKEGRQLEAFQKVIPLLKDKADWCAFFDVDEFMEIDDGVTFEQFLANFNNENGVYVCWEMYGADGHVKAIDANVVDTFTKKCPMPKKSLRGGFVKSIVNLNKNPRMHSNHHVTEGVNTMGLHTYQVLCTKKARLKHYFTKSWEEWCWRFYERGDVYAFNRRPDEFFESNPDMLHMKDELLAPLEKFFYKQLHEHTRKKEWEVLLPIADGLHGVVTSKCGCSTLAWCCAEYMGIEHKVQEHNNVRKYRSYGKVDWKVFSVYRDPVERLVSFYTNKVIDENHNDWLVSLGMMSCSFDEVLSAVESSLTNDSPFMQDQHIRRQVDTYPVVDIDIIVPLEHLDDFLRENGITPPHQNVSKGEKPTLTQEQEERIKKLYAADYELLKSPKVWTPSKKS